jgi:hypothetical protein
MDQIFFILLLWGEPVSGFATPTPEICAEIAPDARDDLARMAADHPFGLGDGSGAITRASDWDVDCRTLDTLPDTWIRGTAS